MRLYCYFVSYWLFVYLQFRHDFLKLIQITFGDTVGVISPDFYLKILPAQLLYVDVVISPHFRNLFFMATTRYGIYYFLTFKMGLFHVVRQGLGVGVEAF
jgi:hypothetical protein